MSDPNIANMLDMTPRGVCPVCGEEWGDGWQTHKADCTAIGPHKIAPDPRDRELEILRAQVRVLAGIIGDCVNDTVPECPSDLDECPLINQEDPCPVCADCFEGWSRCQAEKEVGNG